MKNPFDNPMDQVASQITGEPPEIYYLREMAKLAAKDLHEAHKRLTAVTFALKQYDIAFAPIEAPETAD